MNLPKHYTICLLLLLLQAVAGMAANEKYRLVWNGDPATTMVIAWNQTSGENPTIWYGTSDFGSNYSQYPFTHQPDEVLVYKGMNNHFARLSGLQPDRNYYFVIVDSEGQSDRFWFRTLPAQPGRRLSIISGGDTRSNRALRQKGNLLVGKLKPDFVLFSGDLTFSGTNRQLSDWLNDWQLTTADDGKMTPIIPARGNHEPNNQITDLLFDCPGKEAFYTTTIGQHFLKIFTLNTEIASGGNQKMFLESELSQSANIDWKIAQYHRPIRPHASFKAEMNNLYTDWAPLFYQYNVQLVMEGDAHLTKITYPLRPSTDKSLPNYAEGFVRDDIGGTVYAGEGSWGAPLYIADDDKVWTRQMERMNQFKWLWIDEAEIEIRTIRLDNAFDVECMADGFRFVPPHQLDIFAPKQEYAVSISKRGRQKPELHFISPTNNSELSIGVSTQIAVEATYGPGLEAVDFFVNGEWVGQATAPPYVISYAPPKEGRYTCYAQARGRDGMLELSTPLLLGVGQQTQIINRSIQLGSDDAEEAASGTIDLYNIDLDLVEEGGSQKVGLRFQCLGIPRGTIIDSAFVQFTVHEENSLPAQLQLYAEKRGNAPTFGPSDFNISQRQKSTAVVNWSPEVWTFGKLRGRSERTPDLRSLVQEVVNLSKWSEESALALIIEGNGLRVAESIEGERGAVAKLLIFVSNDVAISPALALPGTAITHSDDDAEESDRGVVNTGSFDLDFLGGEEKQQTIGLRFVDLSIPRNTVIDSAYIQFFVDDVDTAFTQLNIYGQYSPFADPFHQDIDFDISSRPKTTASVEWQPGEWRNIYAGTTNERTPNLRNIVQEMIYHPNWTSLSPMAFIIKGMGSRQAVTYNALPALAPRLIIHFHEPSVSAIEELELPSIELFPNPVSEHLYINSIESCRYDLYDIKGRRLLSGEKKAGQKQVSVATLDAGVYVITFQGQNGASLGVRKIVVK